MMDDPLEPPRPPLGSPDDSHSPGDRSVAGDQPATGSEVGADRAREFFQRVLADYGDDSVAQLGGAHVAIEGVSNVLTKVIEWGRLASYLEQSTRYIAYDSRLGGRFRYLRDPDILGSPLGHTVGRAPQVSVRRLGEELAGPQVAGLLVVGVILTVALLGGVVIAAKDQEGKR